MLTYVPNRATRGTPLQAGAAFTSVSTATGKGASALGLRAASSPDHHIVLLPRCCTGRLFPLVEIEWCRSWCVCEEVPAAADFGLDINCVCKNVNLSGVERWNGGACVSVGGVKCGTLSWSRNNRA